MNTLVDPIYMGFFGGKHVGKTALLRRIANLSIMEEDETIGGLNCAYFYFNLKNNLRVKVKIIDFASDLLTLYHPNRLNVSSANQSGHQNPLSVLIPNLDCAFLVIDVTNKQSLLQCNQWIESIIHYRKNNSNALLKYIIANKADMPLTDRIISPKNLERWRMNTESLDWAFTVGHRELGDVDVLRGDMIRQRCVEDILMQVLLLILQRRDNKYFKLLRSPPLLHFQYSSWISLDKEDLGDQASVLLVS